jgi:hypothetical protein
VDAVDQGINAVDTVDMFHGRNGHVLAVLRHSVQ